MSFAAPRPSRALSPDLNVDLGRDSALDVGRGLLAFNWLPAAYAHRDWLGAWGELLEPRDTVGVRLVRRVSGVLLDRYDLRERYVRDLGSHGWLVQPHVTIRRVATWAQTTHFCCGNIFFHQLIQPHVPFVFSAKIPQRLCHCHSLIATNRFLGKSFARLRARQNKLVRPS